MAGKPVIFDEESARRIASVVKDYAPRPHNISGRRIPCDIQTGDLVPLRITGDRTCGGVYAGRILQLLDTPFNAEASTFDDADIGETDGDEVTIVNWQERAQSTHALTQSDRVCHDFWGRAAGRQDTAGRDVFIINGVDVVEGCEPE